jgi:tricorn protease
MPTGLADDPGGALYVGDNFAVRLLTDGLAARRIGHAEFGRILELAVAPDGRTAAVACADGRLVALDGEPVFTEIARSANDAVSGLAFSPDSALLA